MFNFFVALVILVSSKLVQAAPLNKVYEFNFKPQQTVYMHSGSKSTIHLTSVPGDIDLLQISLAHRKDAPRAHLIGKQIIDMKHSANQGSIDINIQIEELKDITQARYPIELKFKALKEIDGKYIVTEHFSNFIRMIACPTNEQPVCGTISRTTRSKNKENELIKQTFLNFCELEKAGATLVNYGICD